MPVSYTHLYSRELSFSGSTQEYYHLREERNFTLDVEDLCKTLENGYDFLILCNPNNPTSSAIMQEDLRKLIAFCADKDIFVMIDETYVEFAPDVEEITAIPLTREFTNLMVLRGVSKFYACLLYTSLWNDLNTTQKKIISDNLITQYVKKGTIIHNGNLDCTGLLLVKSGQLRTYILSDEGREITLYRLFDMDMCLLSASCLSLIHI